MSRWLLSALLCLLCAGNALATLYAEPASWNFGQVEVGHDEIRWVQITTSGPDPVEVTGIVTGTAFSTMRPIHFILQPGDSGMFVGVVFTPPAPQEYTGDLVLYTTDPTTPDLTVLFVGLGVVTPPETVLLLTAPENGAWVESLPVTFDWEQLQQPEDPLVYYTLWIRAITPDSNQAPVSYPTGEATMFVLDDPSYTDSGYLWWVTADWIGGTVNSQTWYFRIGTPPSPPPMFELLSPENDATVFLPNGTFVWSTLPYPNVPAQACVYELWVVPVDSVNGEFEPLSMSTEDTTATLDLSSFANLERCYWFVVAHLSNGTDVRSNGVRMFHLGIQGQPAGVDEPKAPVATAFGIASAAPNPFNPETRITLNVPLAGHVTAEVFDVLGRKVATLVDAPLAAGEHTMTWRPHGPAGMYILRVQNAQGASDVRKLLFIK